ncbi:CDP-diacylglycerol--glycerol-3-phosphate 3-phosphatidyltransferase [Candidatus Fokinia crypta]|uniref:CDP-diacylglycerol--glycerol-3-phosphate 3-phosphatidyltransferase n=1 Tax=Candidatus Fokinia crypta TaxID=1920990 RepID=A0ABZ0UTJ3_9RICK|nr:CDP-diacylglycerol--glycerol-3-phosphate 3-phosphatidyltransferase [Candidatus Fokinia cryptica]WPX98008.1 CDP-diacylglycerol--glycerol-3-phosphate 3-phosphatidyltransferase [Candidatus Fokinia cryptica]
MHKIIKSIPNFITLLRILLIPVLVMSFYIPGSIGCYTATAIFIFVSITDLIDGYLARTLKSQSNFGRVFDPVADKMLIAAVLLMIAEQKIVPTPLIVIILCREIFVSGMREYLAVMRVEISVKLLGKVKTCAQMIAVTFLLLSREHLVREEVSIAIGFDVYFAGEYLIWSAAFLTLISGLAYFLEGMRKLNEYNTKQ